MPADAALGDALHLPRRIAVSSSSSRAPRRPGLRSHDPSRRRPDRRAVRSRRLPTGGRSCSTSTRFPSSVTATIATIPDTPFRRAILPLPLPDELDVFRVGDDFGLRESFVHAKQIGTPRHRTPRGKGTCRGAHGHETGESTSTPPGNTRYWASTLSVSHTPLGVLKNNSPSRCIAPRGLPAGRAARGVAPPPTPSRRAPTGARGGAPP